MSQGVALVVRARGRVVRGGRGGRVGGAWVRAWALGAGLAGLVVLTGCAADRPPQVIQSDYTQPPVSPTPTPSATALTAPVRPPEMERTDEVGAVAAATYFLEVYDYAAQTGDVTEWTSLSVTTCQYCANLVTAVAGIYGSGDRLDGGGTTLGSVQVVGYDEQLVAYTVAVEYEMGSSRRVDAAGTVIEEYAGETGALDLLLGPSVRGWVLLEGQYRADPRP